MTLTPILMMITISLNSSIENEPYYFSDILVVAIVSPFGPDVPLQLDLSTPSPRCCANT